MYPFLESISSIVESHSKWAEGKKPIVYYMY